MIRLFGKEIRKIFHPKPGSDTPPRLNAVTVCCQLLKFTAHQPLDESGRLVFDILIGPVKLIHAVNGRYPFEIPHTAA